MKNLAWVITAALAAYACELAAHHATPVDQALWLVALCVAAVAWAAAEPAVMVAVPLLIVCEIAVADEGLRLLLFGVIWSAAALLPLSKSTAELPHSKAIVAIACIVVLRWIPLENVLWFRELLLLGVALAIVLILGSTPFAVGVAVITALVTPAVPLRTLALPLAVLAVAALARWFGMPRWKLTVPSTVAVAFVLLFFAWSGIVARAFPYFLKRATPEHQRAWIGEALPASRSLVLRVPDNATHLIVSGANVPRFKAGALLGSINGKAIRIGDAADWGYMRRDHFYGARNPLPRDPAGKIRDYGYAAWVDGAGRVALPRGARTIRVTADAGLPKDAALQVESFELR